jgi:hypothetical protein
MLLKIIVSLLLLTALFLLYVVTRPASYHVERSLTILAPAELLFEQVNDLHRFNTWNPFLKADPQVKLGYSGPESGLGSVNSWDGNRDIGAGSATIIASTPGQLVRMRMDWKRPMEGVATVEFRFRPGPNGTVVTWAMDGENGFLGKLVSVFMNIDKMCGPQFESGLAGLAKAVQAGKH